jgi:hypothetical protein
MRAEATGPGAAGADERGGIVGAIIFVVVSLVLIATAPLTAGHASAGSHLAGSSAMEAAR